MTSRRRLLINAALVVARVLVGTGTWWLLRPGDGQSADAATGTVRTVTAQRADVTATIAAQGNLGSAKVTDVSFATSGPRRTSSTV